MYNKINLNGTGDFPLTLFPLDTGRELNVRKMFRRRPKSLPYVFRTFNLCPVTLTEYPTKKPTKQRQI